MQPLRFPQLTNLVAEQTGHTVGTVEAVLRIYYRHLREQLSSLAFPRIQVANLGTFSLKYKKTEQRLTRRHFLLDRLEHCDAHPKYKTDVNADIALLTTAVARMDQERERKSAFRKTQQHLHEAKHHSIVEAT